MNQTSKSILKNALRMAITVAENTNNKIDDIVVKASAKILCQVFKLGEL